MAAFALRAWSALRAPIIESDGVYYAELARALARGDLAAGLSPAWPPLYPVAIAALLRLATLLGHAITPVLLEACARAVSVVAGTLLLLPLHRLALRLLGPRGALVAILFAAFHPRLVQFSGAALTESTFAACLVSGVAALAAGQSALAGAAFGLSYLARPEGLPLGVGCWLAALLAGRGRPWRERRRWAFPAALALVAAPYALFVSLELGHPSLGEKGAYNFWREYRVEYARAYAEPAGLSERVADSPALARGIPPPRVHALGFVAREPRLVIARSARNLGEILASSYPVAVYPLVALLALVGLVRLTPGPWWTVLVPAALFPLLYAPFTVDRRFFVPAIPLVALLAAGGFEALATALAARTRSPGPARRLANGALACLVAGSLLYLALRVRPIDDAPEHRAAGLWLAGHRARARAGSAPGPIVLSRKPWVAFYAGGLVAELPEGELERILDRARSRGGDALVVDARWAAVHRPALAPLLDPARAPATLRPLYRVGGPWPLVLYGFEGRP
jgi:4-amino-4-deoxy-L-arabinose transferase-like glycosyltransferase